MKTYVRLNARKFILWVPTANNGPPHDKTNNMTVCPTWSASSLSTWRNLGSLATHWAHWEDSDQTGQMPWLISLHWAHSHCWFCHVLAQLCLCGNIRKMSVPVPLDWKKLFRLYSDKMLCSDCADTHCSRLPLYRYSCTMLTLSMLGKNFSRQHFEIFYLFFPENRLWHFMQIVSLGDNLLEMSMPVF